MKYASWIVEGNRKRLQEQQEKEEAQQRDTGKRCGDAKLGEDKKDAFSATQKHLRQY